MKEKRPFKRFDLFSALAAFSVLLILLFESFFIFELYEVDLFKPGASPAEKGTQLPAVQEPASPDTDEVVPVG